MGKTDTVNLCEYCIQELQSHGEKIHYGNSVEECECYFCSEMDDCYECLWRD